MATTAPTALPNDADGRRFPRQQEFRSACCLILVLVTAHRQEQQVLHIRCLTALVAMHKVDRVSPFLAPLPYPALDLV